MTSIALAAGYPIKDNVDNSINWVATGGWAITTTSSHSAITCWTDSPNGAYLNNTDSTLSLASHIDLSSTNNPALLFWHKYELETDFDYASVEISSDGNNWDTLFEITGIWREWKKEQVDLSDYKQANILIRFRLISDKTITGDGWYIDDIRIADQPEPVMQLQVAPSTSSSTAVDLTWTQSYDDNFVSYKIIRSTDEGFSQSKILVATISDPLKTTLTESNLQPETTYYYKVFVVNTYDIESGSKLASVTTGSSLDAYPFFDNAERINSRWTVSGSWGLELMSSTESHSGVTTTVWTDSPYAAYNASTDSSLQISIGLGKALMPVLSFKQKYAFNSYSDYGYVEVKETAATSWTKLFFITGSEATWMTENIDLTEYAGKIIDIRFRITSDNNGQQSQGWFIDDIRIGETDNASIPYPFHDEMEDESSEKNWHTSSWKMMPVDNNSHFAYTDSPEGNYGAYVNSTLIMSNVIDLVNAEKPKMVFEHIYNIYSGTYNCGGYYSSESDYGRIYLSTYYGHPGTWEQIGSFVGSQSDWKKQEIDLQKWAGLSNIRIKFVIEDHSHYRGCNQLPDGWTIDNIKINEAPTASQLNQPTNITKHSIQLTWTKNTDNDFSKYIIYRSPTSNSSYEVLTEISNQNITEYTDTSITSPNSTYYYKIIIEDTENITTQSNEVYATSSWGIPSTHYPMTDDMEGADNFGNDLPWKTTDEDAHSGTKCWSDSPNSFYENNTDKSLYTRLNLGEANRPMLTFWHRYNLEANADYAYVDVSKDNGANWYSQYFVTGFSGAQWSKVEIDLSDYANNEIMIRFRIKTNGTNTFDGWYIDDISVAENKAITLFPFFEDMESEDFMETNWIASTWGKYNADMYNGNACFADTPSGNGGTYVYSDLVLRGRLDFSDAQNPHLSFWQRYHSHKDYRNYVYISTNNGNSWSNIYNVYGTLNDWQRIQLDLSQYKGLPEMSIMFRTYGHSSYDGWYLDDILISDAPLNVNLEAPFNITEHSMAIQWSENQDNDFAQYEIYRSQSAGVNRSSTLIGTITDQSTTSYTDTYITFAGTTYYYKVYVVDQEGLYNQGSNEVSGVTIKEILNAFPYNDSMESGDFWLNDLPWEITDEDAHSGTYSWSDSPDGLYENSINKSISLKINLGKANRPILSFWHRYNLESNADFAFVEISTNNGSSWAKFYYVTGFSGEKWEQVFIDLSDYARSEVFIRFRIETNAANAYDGWHIDDVAIIENTAIEAFPFYDGIDSVETLSRWIPSTWDMIVTDGYSGMNSIADSPKGNGGTYVHQDLTLKGQLDLSESKNPQLSFWHKFHSHKDYRNYVFISANGGQDWVNIWSTYGTQNEWKKVQCDLSAYMGISNVSVKFRTYGHSSYDGWYLDDIQIDDAPVNVQLHQPSNIQEHSITLNWTESTDNDFAQYELYRNTSANVTRDHTLIATITDKSIHSYTDTTIEYPNRTYYYRVFIRDTTDLYNQGTNEVSGTTTWGISENDFPLFDSMESDDNWGNESPWAITDEDSHTGSFSWSDSPDGPYENNMDRSLYTRIYLANTNRPLLEFWHRYNFENYVDFGYLEVSTDIGKNWSKIYFVTGFSGLNWEKVEIDLSSYANQELYLRFRIITNGSQAYDGWHIDDVKITENKTVIPYPFVDDMEDNDSTMHWITSTWGKINNDAYSGNHSLADSPRGNGGTGVYSSLVSRGTLDFSKALYPKLSFWYHSYSDSSSYRYYVYISNNGGHDWKSVWNTYGREYDWKKVEIDLSAYKGLPDIAVRFMSVGHTSYDGWYLDDIRIGEDQSIPTTIHITSGDQQVCAVETQLTRPLVASIFDTNSMPVADIPVTFEIISEGGVLSITQTRSDGNGHVQTFYTAGPASGDNLIKASIEDSDQSVTFTARSLVPGIPVTLNKISGDRQAGLVNSQLANPFVVKIVDVNNNPVPEIPLQFYILSGAGTLSYTDGQTDENGLASSLLTFGEIPEKVTVLVSSAGLIGSPVSYIAYATLNGGSIGDVDGDHMPDDWENMNGLDPADPSDAANDTDNDQLTNVLEYANATNPNQSDSDGDNMPDGWEIIYGLNPNDYLDAMDDNDNDGATNYEEYLAGSIPVYQKHFQLAGITDNWIDIYGTITIDTVPAEVGDEIAVLDDDGIICGQFTVTSPGTYGFMHVFKDDPKTLSIDEGADVDDPLTIKIWDSSEAVEISASMDVITGTQPLSWTFDGDVANVNVNGGGVFSIPLQKGWNLISFPIKTCYYVDNIQGYADGQPNVPMLPMTMFKKVNSIADILSSIDGKYTVVRSSDKIGAHTFDPALPEFSDMKYMACGYGYWIEMTEAANLELQGIRANASDHIELSAGWNLVGYWHPNTRYHSNQPTVSFPYNTNFSDVNSISDVLFSIDGKYDVIRSFDSDGAHTFDPMLEMFSDVYYMGPGYGYWIKMNTTGQLSY